MKDVIVTNISNRKSFDKDDILANPIYRMIIGSSDVIEGIFDGSFSDVLHEMKKNLKL